MDFKDYIQHSGKKGMKWRSVAERLADKAKKKRAQAVAQNVKDATAAANRKPVSDADMEKAQQYIKEHASELKAAREKAKAKAVKRRDDEKQQSARTARYIQKKVKKKISSQNTSTVKSAVGKNNKKYKTEVKV